MVFLRVDFTNNYPLGFSLRTTLDFYYFENLTNEFWSINFRVKSSCQVLLTWAHNCGLKSKFAAINTKYFSIFCKFLETNLRRFVYFSGVYQRQSFERGRRNRGLTWERWVLRSYGQRSNFTDLFEIHFKGRELLDNAIFCLCYADMAKLDCDTLTNQSKVRAEVKRK